MLLVSNHREEMPKESQYVYITLSNGTKFRLNESVDGKLTVNKSEDPDFNSAVAVFPRSGNEIDLK